MANGEWRTNGQGQAPAAGAAESKGIRPNPTGKERLKEMRNGEWRVANEESEGGGQRYVVPSPSPCPSPPMGARGNAGGIRANPTKSDQIRPKQIMKDEL